MMTRYIVVSENEIVKAEMERPGCWFPLASMGCPSCEAYGKHIRSLPRIAIQGKHNWKVWQEVKEGKDFEFGEGRPIFAMTDKGIKNTSGTVAIPIEQTKSEQGETVFGEWQLCPKCNGQGLIEKPPYLAAEVTEWVSTGELFTCDVCDGAKILSRPLLTNDNTQTP